MRYFTAAAAFLALNSAYGSTECHWKKVRETYTISYDSNLVNPKTLKECFQSIKKPVVLTESFEDGNEFGGEVYISSAETGEVIESCPTETVSGLDQNSEFDRNRLTFFIQDIQASGDSTGETTTNSPKWQSYFDSKIRMACQLN